MLHIEGKKRAVALGTRIGLVFLVAVSMLVLMAYYVLSKNFEELLTDYTTDIEQAMVQLGVAAVEEELQDGKEEAAMLAVSLAARESEGQPGGYTRPDVLRTVYVTPNGSQASDGRRRDIRERPDIRKAFTGENAVYGPYFNEENEFVICFSAPVLKDGEAAGVLSTEKDGYRLSQRIKNINFVQSGESYIINEEGTDIAVSNQEHISWVQTQYNAREILKGKEDRDARSVDDLEQKGLRGETGAGTFYWEGSLCYVAYAPIPSTGWVLLTGIREEEIAAMTHSTLYASLVEGVTPGIYITIFLLMVALIIFWIISSMRKAEEINEKLNRMANYDDLTGVKNRNSYHAAMDSLSKGEYRSRACVYIDVNGLHEINNHLGHQAGDQMLKDVAQVLRELFPKGSVYRIGGDEFVISCQNIDKEVVRRKAESARAALKERGCEISIGLEWRKGKSDSKSMTDMAEKAMQRDKQRYYQEDGGKRQQRELDQKLERMVLEKQDADTFLSVLAPEFKGVYFVDMGRDTIRHLFIPPYFEEMLKETEDVFSAALALYIQRIVKPEYQQRFKDFCNYSYLEEQLDENITPEHLYQETDGSWKRLRVVKFKTYTLQNRETLWIFANADGGSPLSP